MSEVKKNARTLLTNIKLGGNYTTNWGVISWEQTETGYEIQIKNDEGSRYLTNQEALDLIENQLRKEDPDGN